MSKETGGPAFAVAELANITWEGMTLRDYFAAKAMQGLVSNGETDSPMISKAAYIIADHMLKAREV